MTKLLLVANWKMNHGPASTRQFLFEFSQLHPERLPVEYWIASPSVSFDAFKEMHGPRFGAQNVHWESAGAYTGELSPELLIECGCSFTLVGHSERRQLFGEHEVSAARRANSALRAGLDVVFCVGETRAERDSGATFSALARQLNPLLESFPTTDSKASFYIAYEPIWAVGSDHTPGVQEIDEAHLAIRNQCLDRKVQLSGLLYGGSVNTSNIHEISKSKLVDGALIGRASLQAASLYELGKKACGHST